MEQESSDNCLAFLRALTMESGQNQMRLTCGYGETVWYAADVAQVSSFGSIGHRSSRIGTGDTAEELADSRVVGNHIEDFQGEEIIRGDVKSFQEEERLNDSSWRVYSCALTVE